MEAVRVGETMVVGPGRLRRLLLLSAVCVVSGVAAYLFPRVGLWHHSAPVVFAISFLAGFTALWSP